MRSPSWPSTRAYCEAIVDPTSLADPDLQRGTLESSVGRLPKAYAGMFTATFHFETARGEVAFRCFTRGHDALQQRYTAIGELLRYVRSDALCQTRYEPEAIRVDGAMWPAVIMEWVPGLALNAEIERLGDDGDAILALATRFREVVRSLGALGIAHGDLQHGNILVSHGELRLIDYDAMFLPAIANLAQAEYGHRNYQHPDRRSAAFDGRLDRFSSIVIYTALVALAADPSLWKRFDDGSNLLFRAHDFTSNGQSDLFRTLLASNATSGLADVLRAACRRPVEAVPTLEEAIRAAAGTMPADVPIPPPRPPVRRAADFDAVPAPPREAPAPQSVHAFIAAPLEEPSFVPLEESHRVPREAPIAPPPAAAAKRPLPSLRVVTLVTVLVGLAIGFALAAWRQAGPPRVADSKPQAVAAVDPRPAPTHAAVAKATAAPRVVAKVAAKPTLAPVVATPMPTIAPTVAPTVAPTAVVTARPTVAPATAPAATTPPTSHADYARLRGAWQFAEANNQVGTIVWSGAAVVADGGTIVLDAHKASVAGQTATPCERRTTLHATIALGVAQQVVPYRETNCAGTTSSGEIRVARFSRDAGSFVGSVWKDGVKLGDFTASKR